MFEIGLSTLLGLVATIFSRDDLEWTPKNADGSPLIDDDWSSIGHQVVGSFLACALCTPLCTPPAFSAPALASISLTTAPPSHPRPRHHHPRHGLLRSHAASLLLAQFSP